MSDTRPPDASGEDFETLKEVGTAQDRAGPPEELEPGELIEALQSVKLNKRKRVFVTVLRGNGRRQRRSAMRRRAAHLR